MNDGYTDERFDHAIKISLCEQICKCRVPRRITNYVYFCLILCVKFTSASIKKKLAIPYGITKSAELPAVPLACPQRLSRPPSTLPTGWHLDAAIVRSVPSTEWPVRAASFGRTRQSTNDPSVAADRISIRQLQADSNGVSKYS